MFKHTLQRRMVRWGTMFLLMVMPVGASAQGLIVPDSMVQGIASMVIWLIAVLNLLTWVVFLLLDVLLDPSFIFDSTSGGAFLTMLNSIWVLSRDLMNIAFAFILIGAAVYTIVTAKKDLVANHMKTFVLAVILVNFSWFIPRVILDIGNVAASAVYGIPSLLVTTGTAPACRFSSMTPINGLACTPAGGGSYNCQCGMVVNARFFLSNVDAQAISTGANAWSCPLGQVMCVKFQTLDPTTTAGHSTVLNGLIVNHARLQGLATVPPSTGTGTSISSTILFLMKEIIVLAIHIALFFPLAAMLMAFAIRIPVLWLTIAFMPLTVLKFVLPSEYIGEYPQKLWDYFLKAAFLPVIAAVPFTVGFIMINAMSIVPTTSPALAGIASVGIRLTDSISDFWELLWLGMTLGVLWTAIFTVLAEDKIGIMGKGTSFFKGIGESLGGIAVKGPLSLPVIPGLGGHSIFGLGNAAHGISSKLSAGVPLPKILEDLRNRGPAYNEKEIKRSAEGMARSPGGADIKTLTRKIDELTRARARGASTSEMENLIRSMKNDLKFNFDINVSSPHEALRKLHEELDKKMPTSADVRDLKTKIDALASTSRP